MRTLTVSALLATATVVFPAHAATFVVKAFDHSIDSGTGSALNTGLNFTLGDALTVSASTDDLWSAGALPRFSDANGLIADRLATSSDDSGQAVGTQIGANFGAVTIDGFAAPFGSLVGRIGSAYQLLGTSYSGGAWATGTLELFYWDTFTGDNTGEISVAVNGVPEPATWGMMLAGFGMAGAAMRRRTRAKLA